MQNLRSKVAYIQGLAEGIDLQHSKEGKILVNIIRLMEDMAKAIEQMETRHEELETYMESIDEDLQDLEEDVYEEMAVDDITNEAFDELDYVEVECPGCRDIVCFEADIIDDEDSIEVTCPNCDEIVYVNDGTFEMDSFHYNRHQPTEGSRTEDI